MPYAETGLWGGKRYRSLNYYLQNEFGQKVYKIALDGRFTCPNRDGSKGTGGCYFCSPNGSGDFTPNRNMSIEEQWAQGQELIRHKAADKYIAYFQAYTGTYGSVQRLRELYLKALNLPGVVGLAVATRPDCLGPEIIEFLQEISTLTNLWLELGLQTVHRQTAELLNMQYYFDDFRSAVERLNKVNIKICAHIMLGLPGETRDDMLTTAQTAVSLPIWGIKIHSLYILRGTRLGAWYEQKPFKLLSLEEYVDLVTDILEITPSEMVVHRLTGDGPRGLVMAPLWSLEKHRVLNYIDAELEQRNTWQGKRAKEN
jgi:radical SAM protein (TIGR01212 family)